MHTMRKLASLTLGSALALGFALGLGGCQDAVTKICLSEEGNSQDCGIACTTSKNEDACKKWEKLTLALCDKKGKEVCQEICEKDENKYACEKAKSM